MSKTDVSDVDEARGEERGAFESGLGRIAAEIERQGRQYVAHPGPTSRTGEDRLAVFGVLSAGFVGDGHHQIGDGLCGKEHLVPTGTPVQSLGGPRQPRAQPGFDIIHGHVREVVGGDTGPGRSRPVAAPGHQLERALGLGMGQAHTGRGAQVPGRATMLGESGQHVVGGSGPAEGSGQLGQHPGEDGEVGLAGRGVERGRPLRSGPGRRGLDERSVVVGGRGSGCVRFGGADQLEDVDVTAAAGYPRSHPALDVAQADHGHPPAAPPSVGRGGVVGQAHLDLARLFDDHDTVVTAGASGGQAVLHHRLGRWKCAPAHRPDSRRALRTRTSRTRTDGQPWETGATWPG